MNSINKLCQAINNKLDTVILKIDSIDHKIQLLENKIQCIENNKTIKTIKTNTTEKKIHEREMISLSKKTKVVKSGSITIKEYKDCILICGDTYDKKIIIKKYKGLWNPANKGWIIKNKTYKEALLKSLQKNTKKVKFSNIHTNLLSPSVHEESDDIEHSSLSSTLAFLDDE